ncbi:MAG TPA: hypothetical protein VGN17_26090 [Bryobacteraceae bacterium]|jgi:hypothetical protein
MLYGELNTIKLDSGETVQGLKVKVPHPSKVAVIRRPTDKELAATTDKFAKLKRKNPDSEDKIPYLDLFNSIRLDPDGDEFDEYEAEHIIGWVISAAVTSAETVNDELVVSIKTPLCNVGLTLRFPTFKEASILKTNQQLFDALFLRREGYAECCDVPLLHKSLALGAINEVHSAIDPYVNVDPNA